MNTQDFREVLLKIQAHLSDNDRKRLRFYLDNNPSLSDTLRSDQDKISEQDITDLVKILQEIQCEEAVKLLKEHINQIQSTMPLVPIQDDEKYVMRTLLADQKPCCDINNMLINSNNTNINPITVVLGSRSKFPLRSNRRHVFNRSSMTQNYLLLFIIISIILAGLVVIGSIRLARLKTNCDHMVNEKMKNVEIIQRLTNLELNINRTVQQLANKVTHFDKKQEFTEGTTCGCDTWCRTRGSRYGVCGDGHTCICRMEPITKSNTGDECTCDSWCREHGHQNGGICGDGYTCLCSKLIVINV